MGRERVSQAMKVSLVVSGLSGQPGPSPISWNSIVCRPSQSGGKE